ncbi:hypothetical protein BV509_07155 [Rhodovulum sulfidophilum]|nr:hypothetical protein BV509_07155 [Rhodovulum sulfidophilum]
MANDADVDFGGLAVRGSRGDALSEGLGAEPGQRHRSERPGAGIFASARLRAWYPVRRVRNALPRDRVARRVSLRGKPISAIGPGAEPSAAGQSSVHGRPFFRTGMIAVAPRRMMAL